MPEPVDVTLTVCCTDKGRHKRKTLGHLRYREVDGGVLLHDTSIMTKTLSDKPAAVVERTGMKRSERTGDYTYRPTDCPVCRQPFKRQRAKLAGIVAGLVAQGITELDISYFRY